MNGRTALKSSLLAASALAATGPFSQNYKSFKVCAYIPVSTVNRMADDKWLEQSYETINRQIKFDKVYIETYRSRVVADDALIEKVKRFFQSKGIEVAGGVAFSDAGGNGQFVTHSYVTDEDRNYVKNVMEMTAKHFDEIILDDFFFNMNKSDAAITAKGNKTWTNFRLDLMDDAARNLIVGPAKKVNPKVKVVIKFPNWYEHFQALGYDLDKEPQIFDGIYAGTETRDAEITDQHLQPYESYQIVRYFENIAPGRNGGGWVDTFSIRTIDRYVEQLWDTVFAKAPEMMIFTWDLMLRPPQYGHREAWQDMHTSFDLADMLAQYDGDAKTNPPTMGSVAGYALQQADKVVYQLGKPIGIASYKPYQSTGEDFLHNWLGTIGIPIDLRPEYPQDAPVVLLTESAKYDAHLVDKIKKSLQAGHSVVITSGLLRAIQGHLADICEVECTDRKAMVDDIIAGFGAGNGNSLGRPAKPILFPQIRFMTNDSWPIIRGQASGNGYPIMLMDRYSKGLLYILAIPDNFSDLYNLPSKVLDSIRHYVMGSFPVRLSEAPDHVALFAYDNGTFIVQSYRDTPTEVTISAEGSFTKLRNLLSGEELPSDGGSFATGSDTTFKLVIKPHSYLAYKTGR